jgi:N-terminal half of MaoC dehydratase
MTDLIDREKALQLQIEPVVFDMERGRLRFFAETIGLTEPVYLDSAAAQGAGYPDILVPPTFLGNALELELPQPLSWLAALGVDLERTTHGEQSFEYHALAFAGDRLTFKRSIADVYVKKGGALEFVVKRTKITRDDGTPIAEVLCTLGIFH